MRRRDESGAAVALALGLVALLVLVAAVALGVTALVAGHRKAQAAADLAALAAASSLREGADPCAEAHEIAAANEASVTSCAVQGQTVSVSVVVQIALLGERELRARARAGPSEVGTLPAGY